MSDAALDITAVDPDDPEHPADGDRSPLTARSRSWDEPTGARKWGRYLLLAAVTFVVLFPIYTTVLSAFSPADRVVNRELLPRELTVQPLGDAWTEGRLGRYLWNSFVVATAVTLAQIVTALLSGYAFAHLRFPGRKVLFVAFLATLLVPFEATVVVNIDTVESLGDWSSWLGGVNTLQALALPFLATAVGTFLIRQALVSLPPDLRDAARIDGIGHIGFLRHVGIPLVRPTLGAIGLFAFLSTWNQYLWPRQIITEDDKHTVQSGLRQLGKAALDRPNLVMAGTVIAAIPILVVLIVFQRQLVRGLTAGAVKG
ncbi:MAG: carbohydrate ABC transporter permease [Actinomycetota bacterium]